MVALLALASSLVWGTSDFAGGYFTKRVAAVRVVAVAQLGGLLTMCVLVAVRSVTGPPIVVGSWMLYGALAGVTGAIGLVAFYTALSLGTMGVVSPIAAMGALVPVTVGFAGGDHVTTLAAYGLVLMLVGVVLASGPELSGAASRLPVVLAIIAAVAFGLSLYFMNLGAGQDIIPALGAMRVASVGLLVAAWKAWPGGLSGGTLVSRDIPLVLLIGVGDLGANMLFSFAAARGMVSVVSVLGSLYPVVTLIWARILLGERLRPIQLVGVVATVAGIALVVR